MTKNKSKLVKLSAVICLILSFAMVALAQEKTDLKLVAKQFLELKEPILEKTQDPMYRFELLRNLTPAAYRAGAIEKAKN